jgi:hypothetical protein
MNKLIQFISNDIDLIVNTIQIKPDHRNNHNLQLFIKFYSTKDHSV